MSLEINNLVPGIIKWLYNSNGQTRTWNVFVQHLLSGLECSVYPGRKFPTGHCELKKDGINMLLMTTGKGGHTFMSPATRKRYHLLSSRDKKNGDPFNVSMLWHDVGQDRNTTVIDDASVWEAVLKDDVLSVHLRSLFANYNSKSKHDRLWLAAICVCYQLEKMQPCGATDPVIYTLLHDAFASDKVINCKCGEMFFVLMAYQLAFQEAVMRAQDITISLALETYGGKSRPETSVEWKFESLLIPKHEREYMNVKGKLLEKNSHLATTEIFHYMKMVRSLEFFTGKGLPRSSNHVKLVVGLGVCYTFAHKEAVDYFSSRDNRPPVMLSVVPPDCFFNAAANKVHFTNRSMLSADHSYEVNEEGIEDEEEEKEVERTTNATLSSSRSTMPAFPTVSTPPKFSTELYPVLGKLLHRDVMPYTATGKGQYNVREGVHNLCKVQYYPNSLRHAVGIGNRVKFKMLHGDIISKSIVRREDGGGVLNVDDFKETLTGVKSDAKETVEMIRNFGFCPRLELSFDVCPSTDELITMDMIKFAADKIIHGAKHYDMDDSLKVADVFIEVLDVRAHAAMRMLRSTLKTVAESGAYLLFETMSIWKEFFDGRATLLNYTRIHKKWALQHSRPVLSYIDSEIRMQYMYTKTPDRLRHQYMEDDWSLLKSELGLRLPTTEEMIVFSRTEESEAEDINVCPVCFRVSKQSIHRDICLMVVCILFVSDCKCYLDFRWRQ